MEDILLLQAIERYLDGTMLPAEKAYFEELRKNTPEIDQMVVEHNMFLQQMGIYASERNIKHTLHDVHTRLLKYGNINEGGELNSKGKVIRMWNKYRRVTAIAACVGGVIALVISGLVSYYAPVNNSQIEQLKGEITHIKITQIDQTNKIKEVESKLPNDLVFNGSGSGFLIDAKGYIITNAHVLKGSSFAKVINNKGDEFKARIAYRDEAMDLAILKIDDGDFKPLKTLPYGIRKANADLGEEIFTLGYPRNEIVYNMGYLSAKTGIEGDSISYQIQISANPGNSGGPVFDRNGDVIGVLSNRKKQAESVAFAIKSKNIYRLVDELLENDSTVQRIKVPAYSSVKGMERISQVRQMEDCVFLIQAFNKK